MQQSPLDTNTNQHHGVRVAFVGNSILYYNDCPRFLVNLAKGRISYQDSCLRGGTNLSELYEQGNGMLRHGFKTEPAKINGIMDKDGNDVYDVGSSTVKSLLECNNKDEKEGGEKKKWDYVIFNDHTQGPARLDSRRATQNTLLEYYLPLIKENGAIPIVIETAAYRYPDINNSHDLGNTHEFQQRVRDGVESYVQTLRSNSSEQCQARMAPVGSAFLHVHDSNYNLWTKLFDPADHFHPSPCGTFLQGCVLHCTMFGRPPPLPTTNEEIADLWKDARMMHNIKTGESRALPSIEEAEYLWNVAKVVCGCADSGRASHL